MPLRCALVASALTILLLARVGGLAAQDRTTLGGYGEIHYVNPSDATPQVNVKRFVVFLGHHFSDRLSMRSELEVEDTKVAGGSAGGEVALEQLYIDYRLGAGATLRSGLVLVPIGILNETHEPPSFNGVARPAFEHDVIPTTWREIGMGSYGALPLEGFSYRAYLVSGLLASGFTGAEGVRDGRQEGRQASFANPSFTGRLEYARPGLKVGGAFWYGGTSGGDPLLGIGAFAAPVLMVALDARWDGGPFAARALVGNVAVPDAGRVNSAYGTDAGRRMAGGYAEVSVNVLRLLAPASRARLPAFVRHERYDTHAAVPAATPRNGEYARRITTVGVSFLPVTPVAFKGDYSIERTAAGSNERQVLSLGVGYAF